MDEMKKIAEGLEALRKLAAQQPGCEMLTYAIASAEMEAADILARRAKDRSQIGK